MAELDSLERRVLGALQVTSERVAVVNQRAYDGWAEHSYLLRALERLEQLGYARGEGAPVREWSVTYQGQAHLAMLADQPR